MFSKKPTEGKRKHKEDNFDSFSYQCLDDLICSDKKDATAVDNIEDLVDSALAKNKVSSYDERVKDNYFVDSTDRLWRHGGNRKVLGIVNKPLVRKVLSILLSFLLVFVTIVSASILSPQGSSDLEVLSVSLVPENVHNGDYMSVNVTVLGSYHICSVMADMGGIETINLLLSDNSSLEQLWQTVWVVHHDVEVGEYVATITAVDEENASYRSEVRWGVLPEEIPDDNQSSETETNETSAEGNESFNETTPLIDIDDGNMTGNETIISTGLNLSLQSDRDVYFVNETVSIDGTVSYNNSLINTSVGLLIVGSGVNLSVDLNVTDGVFSYLFVPAVIGDYTVQAMVSYENEAVTEELSFSVQNLSLDNVSEVLVSDLYVWDDTDYWVGYVGDLISFYANYSSDNLDIVNASCLISFDVGNWTMPMIMNYSDGFYVYSRSFEVAGTYEYGVWCSASGYENKTMVSECVISITKPGIFEPISQIEVGKPVLWKQRFQAEKNLTVNIPGYAYNISVSGIISEDDIIVLEKNVRKNLREYNIDKRKHVLAKGIRKWLTRFKIDPDELQSKQELYQLYSELKDNISLEEILNETYENIEQYITQFIIEEVEIQLLIPNISDEFEITYLTDGPEIEEEQLGRGRKRITVSSDIHYENVLTYTSIVESPKESVKLYWVVNGSKELVSNVTYVDTNNNDLIDRIEWITPYLSNQTYEIVITKAVHLDENKEFISDIYEEVYKKDDIWSEPIYHDEYIRVTFAINLTENNDITFYARNNQSLDTIVEVYYYDSDEKITEFPIIKQEDFYKVYLTGMEGKHQIFDLKMKNLDNINSAFLEFDYIVDPDTKLAVDSNVTDMDSSADVGIETNFQNAQDTSPDSDYMNIQENNTGGSAADEWLSVSSLDNTWLDWDTESGNPPYVDTADDDSATHSGSYIHEEKTTDAQEGWFIFGDTSETGSGFTVNFTFRCSSDDADEGFHLFYDTTGIGDGTEYGLVIATSTTYIYETVTLTGTFSATEINDMRIYLAYHGFAPADDVYVDHIKMGISRAASTNYEIDFEYNWSNADYDETNEEVCFYVDSHTGSENLNVSYWAGSWTYLDQITGTGWTNLTATGLSDATYEIQLKGATESSDSSRDNWSINVIMLHTWSAPVTVPTVTTNTSTGVEETNATLRGYLQSNGSVDTYTYFVWDNDASGEPYANNQSNGLTANLSEFQYDATTLTSGDLYYFNTKANNSAGWDNDGGELTFFTKPPAVTNLAESASTSTSLTYTWAEATVGTGATAYTRIQYKTGSNPTSISDGTNTYNGTDETDDTTSLTPGTHYYFSAFSWGTEGGIGNWNDAYDTMDAWTNPGDPTSVSTTNGSTWINVTFTHGTNGEYTMMRRNASGSADYPADRTSGTLVDNTTNTYANDTELLAMGVTYYYALWTWDTDGGKWCDNKVTITGITWNLSINATPSQWNLGNVWVGGSNTSTGYYFNITNEGNATLNIQIKASNATNSTTGARWNLTSTLDHNNFTLQYIKSGGGSWTIINTTYDVFVTSLGVDSWQTFDLKMTHATTSSVVDPMSLDMTFKSVAS